MVLKSIFSLNLLYKDSRSSHWLLDLCATQNGEMVLNWLSHCSDGFECLSNCLLLF